jgi:hypothetical protein
MSLLGRDGERTKGHMKEGTSSLELNRQKKASARGPGIPDRWSVLPYPKELPQSSVFHGIKSRGMLWLQLREPRSTTRLGL